MGRYVGHAAIDTSSKFVLEMPGTKISHYATHTSKSTFFKRNTKEYVKNYPSNLHIVTPHGLVGNFVGSFKPNYIHKITKY